MLGADRSQARYMLLDMGKLRHGAMERVCSRARDSNPALPTATLLPFPLHHTAWACPSDGGRLGSYWHEGWCCQRSPRQAPHLPVKAHRQLSSRALPIASLLFLLLSPPFRYLPSPFPAPSRQDKLAIRVGILAQVVSSTDPAMK